ncbi:ATP-dependent Clp protease ATP-binding subunit, partial [Campylobacter jejuni]|nr:ATP-dependent Clp protease ATP-binding subunit [Campylobacter jejuni]
EFLNRVDDIVLFKPLTKQEIVEIVDKMVHQLQVRLTEQNIVLNVTKAAKEFIADQGYDPVYGARPLKRFIQKHLETKIARKIIAGTVELKEGITIDYDHDELVLK